jgi:quercetin dioxygenase-like cupin family protein/DNA-binding transcriptional regulator YiaG
MRSTKKTSKRPAAGTVSSEAHRTRISRGAPADSGKAAAQSSGAASLVGAKLRERRRHLNLTLQEVADRVGVTKGFLSEIERDRAAPSVATLLKLRDALSLSVSTLFHSAIPQVVRQQSREPILYGGTGMTCVLVSPENAHRVIAIHAEFEPGGNSGPEPHSLDSDEEIVLVIEGLFEITISGETYRLQAGDSVTFDPRVPHSYRNASPRGVTKTLCIVAPPPR